jgi:hypothetical protein
MDEGNVVEEEGRGAVFALFEGEGDEGKAI